MSRANLRTPQLSAVERVLMEWTRITVKRPGKISGMLPYAGEMELMLDNGHSQVYGSGYTRHDITRLAICSDFNPKQENLFVWRRTQNRIYLT